MRQKCVAAAMIVLSSWLSLNAKAEDAPGKGTLMNLALNKPASASSQQDQERSAAAAVDGDDSTRWCADGPSIPQWWQVDLQKPEDLTSCRINWEHEAAYQYKVEGSTDAKSWTTLADASRSNDRDQVRSHKFDAKEIRYVRVNITGAENGSWASILEVEVFGTKLAPPGSRKASTTDQERKLLAGVKPPKGFAMSLFAAPPDIRYPTCISTSPTGELYVGMDENGSLDQKTGRGRMIRCVDSTGEGHADKFNVFAEMDSPRGVIWDGDTLYVLHPPFLTAYHDPNHTGTATGSEELLTGLAHDLKWRGADHTTNGIRMGIDGWIYIAAGDYGAPHAVGKDGTELTFHGGGVLRIRPDGSGLEAVSRGERNIYDVAIDSLMNIFTLDNTNDGDGWNVRLAHVFQSANYGYPTLFVNFSDEIVQPLNDYGEGAPTGALFVDEPGLPAPFGHALYFCEWGRSAIFRHPLEPQGASYARPSPREAFIEVPRPTDLDVDGQSNIYIASWRGAVFNYAGPNVGYILRLRPTDSKPQTPPDLKKSSDAQLVQLLKSPSLFWRLQTQREIVRRGDKPEFDSSILAIAVSPDAPLPVRVAAIFTLKQLRGPASNDALIALLRDDGIREFALRALLDDKKSLSAVPAKVFVESLKDPNARVRLQAVIALGRGGHADAAEALVSTLADADPAITHAAVQALTALHATDVCLKVLDSGSPSVVPGATRVLQSFHEPKVVEGLIGLEQHTQNSTTRQGALRALCRLYNDEAKWEGDWWGTRPDTRGPYYHPTKWAETDSIGQALKAALANASPEDVRFLVTELRRHRIEMPEATALMVKLAGQDAAFRQQAANLLLGGSAIPEEALPLIEHIASGPKEDPALRAKALRALQRRSDSAPQFEALVRALAVVGQEPNPPPDVSAARAESVRDEGNARHVDQFAKLATASDAPTRELADAVLLKIVENRQSPADAKEKAARSLKQGWATPQSTASLLRAIGQTKTSEYASYVKSHLQDENAEVRNAALFAALQLQLDKAAASGNQPLINTMKYDDVVALAIKEKGDAALGAQLFVKQGCVMCHTVSAKEPAKGPFLGDIAGKYSRTEILESILKSNAKIAQGFTTHWFDMKDGNRRIGFVTREAGDEVEMRDATGASSVLAKKDIVKRGTLATSIMPEGLADNLSVRDLGSLLAYFESLKAKP